MKRIVIIINFLSICCFSWAFGTDLGATSSLSSQDDELVLEKVFFLHKKAEDVSVVCHASLNKKMSSSQVQQSGPVVSLSDINCEALKEDDQAWPKEEAVGWQRQNQPNFLSEI